MSETIIDFYDSMLTSLGFEITTNGSIKSVILDDKVQLIAGGDPVVMPTFRNLRTPQNKVFFHPLREDMSGGESKTLEAFRKASAVRLNMIYTSIAIDLINVAASPTLQKTLTSEQSDLITGLGEVDEKSVKKVVQICAAMAKKDPFKSFISMYSRRGASIDGKSYKRACIVTFPLYEEILKDEDKVFGINTTTKQRDIFLKLLRFMFPGIDEVDMYSSGSNSKIAPFFDSLISSLIKLYGASNDLLDRYGSRIEWADRYKCDFSSWYPQMENLEGMMKDILSIPSQGGQIQEQETAPVPVQQPMPAVPVLQNSGMMQNPAIPPMMPAQVPQPTTTSLSSLISRNPQTLALAYGGSGIFTPAAMTNMRSAPTWSIPGTPMSPASGVVDPWGRPIPVSPMGAAPVPYGGMNPNPPW